jgi:hypothetical protein
MYRQKFDRKQELLKNQTIIDIGNYLSIIE